ncbi:MAG: hypothetical protein ACR2G5_14135 [Pyrinomonadaceae bacterium]
MTTRAMSPLRQRMLEAMQLRGLSARTQEAYARAVCREGTRLQVADVDSARMLLHIHGKSKQDRYVPLPEPTLQLLRVHWCTHRSPLWLFPAPTRHGLAHSLAHNGGTVTRSSLQSAFLRAWQRRRRGFARAGVTPLDHLVLLANYYFMKFCRWSVVLSAFENDCSRISGRTFMGREGSAFRRFLVFAR